MFRVVPWMTDGSVRFMRGFIATAQKRGPVRVLEFGTGASTMFFSEVCTSVVTFDGDPVWHRETTVLLAAKGKTNVSAHVIPRPYADKAAQLVAGQQFEIISVDGRDRMACIQNAINGSLLAPNGIIVLDNTERITGKHAITGEIAKYAGFLDMLKADFNFVHYEQTPSQPDFAGWIAPHRWITSIAWRRDDQQYTTTGALL